MNNQAPPYVSIVFLIALVYALYSGYRAASKSKWFLYMSLGWIILQSLVSLSGFYTNNLTLPPRFVFLIGPALLSVAAMFLIPGLRARLSNMDTRWLLAISICRFPVELVLYWLHQSKLVPEYVTFEGYNWDIFSGISALALVTWMYRGGKPSRLVLLAWNSICLALLLNVVIYAVFAAETPFQKFSFDRPNRGVFYFPFTLLPGFVVPMVLFSHLALFRKIITKKI